jgi:hypothetical protein
MLDKEQLKIGESPYIHVQYVFPFTFGAGRGTVAKPPKYFIKYKF